MNRRCLVLVDRLRHPGPFLMKNHATPRNLKKKHIFPSKLRHLLLLRSEDQIFLKCNPKMKILALFNHNDLKKDCAFQSSPNNVKSVRYSLQTLVSKFSNYVLQSVWVFLYRAMRYIVILHDPV